MDFKQAMRTFIQEEVRTSLKVVLAEMVSGEAPAARPRGRPKATASDAVEAKPRGRPRRLSDAERKRRAAAYQRMYRARKKAEQS